MGVVMGRTRRISAESFVCRLANIIIICESRDTLGHTIRTVRGTIGALLIGQTMSNVRSSHVHTIATRQGTDWILRAARMQPGATAVTFVFRRHSSLGPSLAKQGRAEPSTGGRKASRSAHRT